MAINVSIILALSLGCLLVSMWLTNVSMLDSRFIFNILAIVLAILGVGFSLLNIYLRIQYNLSSNKIIDFMIIILYVVFAILLAIDSSRRKKILKEVKKAFDMMASNETLHSELDSLERSFLLFKNAIDVNKCVLAPKVKELDIYRQFVSDTSSIIERLKTIEYTNDSEQEYKIYLLFFINVQTGLFKGMLDYLTSSEGKDLNKVIGLLDRSLITFKQAVNRLSDFEKLNKER